MTNDDRVLSPVDVHDEVQLLMRHDMAGLRQQVDARIRRRGVLLWLLPVLLTCVVTATVVLIPQQGSASAAAQHKPRAAEAVVPRAPQPVDETPPGVTVASSPMPVTSPLPVRAQHSTSRTKHLSAVVEPPASAPAEALQTPQTQPSSRLRAQLDAMAEAHDAIEAGDAERAVGVLKTLRATYPTGPIDLDAAVLMVRALLALDRLDEARAALSQAHNHPHAAERRASLNRLQTQLSVDDNDDNDDNGSVRP